MSRQKRFESKRRAAKRARQAANQAQHSEKQRAEWERERKQIGMPPDVFALHKAMASRKGW